MSSSSSTQWPSAGLDAKQQRLYYIDWIRACVIALVVAFHCIDMFFNYTYSAAAYLGVVIPPPTDATRQVAIVLAQLMQSWFMGLLFLISGYFSTPSYNRKGALLFVADRAQRLLVPLLVYDCLLQPLAFEIARHSAYAPVELQAATSGFAYYYSTQFVRLGHGAGWFIAVLFVFDLLYAAVRVCTYGCNCAAAAAASRLQSGSSKDSTELSVTPVAAQPAFSAIATAKGAVGVAALTAGLCLLVRVGALIPLNLPQSLWVVEGIQFQPAYLPQYVVAFVLGLAARSAHSDSLKQLPSGAGPIAAGAAAVLAVTGAVIMSHLPGSNFGHELQQAPSVAYVAVYTVWEQFYAVTMWLAVLVCFRQWVNKEGGKAGAAVSGAAYAVYIIHIPIISAFGLAFAPIALPAAAKCAVVTSLAAASSWLVGWLLKQLPGVKHVL